MNEATFRLELERLLFGANKSLELDQDAVPTWLAAQLKELLERESYAPLVRGPVSVVGDDESDGGWVQLRRGTDDVCTLRVRPFKQLEGTHRRWELGASANVNQPGPIAVYLADWLT